MITSIWSTCYKLMQSQGRFLFPFLDLAILPDILNTPPRWHQGIYWSLVDTVTKHVYSSQHPHPVLTGAPQVLAWVWEEADVMLRMLGKVLVTLSEELITENITVAKFWTPVAKFGNSLISPARRKPNLLLFGFNICYDWYSYWYNGMAFKLFRVFTFR